MNPLVRVLALVAIGSLSTVVGCAASSEADDGAEGGDSTEDALRKGSAEQWVYNGTLPHLEEPSITVSLSAHTARVTGYVPAGWKLPLPYYVDTSAEGARTKVAIVYPIATGASVNSQGNGYEINSVSPWVPTNSKATWGGFPFIPYNRGIAFHGPITATDGQWKLIRGPVSHGCNRMQGEHVVELAHLIGANMSTVVYRGDSLSGFDVPVTILHKPDTWKDQLVDVDYPAEAGVARPTGANVKMFKAWNADQLATFVCPLNKREVTAGVIPDNYCSLHNRDSIDPVTGR